ncbi:ATP-binding protein [Methylobacterium symbioticum]|uniref:histidine kinase n=1 Tax=Methylobacterium symbioticum TaxID=2584084 RepID=A0A509E965_9HYPH|nr:ATP-binding protein [Methylobacterium symbioticum]VUD70710.1 Blue-light-activated protein [Methylobacterium symbioticum]
MPEETNPPNGDEAGGLDPGTAALLDAGRVAALLLDGPEGRILYANPAFRALTGYADADILGHDLGLLGEAALAPAAGPLEFLASRKDGSSFWAWLDSAPVAGGPHRLVQLLDVTRRHEAETALTLSRQREALGLLTNSVAHEFNNFLQILIGYIDGLKRRLGDRPEPFIQRAISRSTDATERAAVLTRQLLAFSRKIAPDVRAIDLDLMVAEAADAMRPSLPGRVRLDVMRTPDLPFAVANPTQVELALRHLVANACEAMPEGGLVTLSTFRVPAGDRTLQQPNDGAVGLLISDTGTGMSPEMLARALAPFSTSREAGRGAGLAIVHGLMKRQNGTISLDSRQNEGTQVRLVFPAAPRRTMH